MDEQNKQVLIIKKQNKYMNDIEHSPYIINRSI